MNHDISTLEIENYLGGDMSPGEKKDFENRLNTDPELRALYDTYKTIDESMRDREIYMDREGALKKTLQDLNQVYFKTGETLKAEQPLVVNMNASKRWTRMAVSIAAAVALILISYWGFWGGKTEAQTLANNYISGELNTLGQTMGAEADSLQQGIEAYNQKQYAEALALFSAVYKNHPDNNEALKNAGISYLASHQYDQALKAFDELAGKDLYSNDGVFLKALTLMQRNAGTDKDTAKQLLQQVVEQKLDKSELAADWLSKWK